MIMKVIIGVDGELNKIGVLNMWERCVNGKVVGEWCWLCVERG